MIYSSFEYICCKILGQKIKHSYCINDNKPAPVVSVIIIKQLWAAEEGIVKKKAAKAVKKAKEAEKSQTLKSKKLKWFKKPKGLHITWKALKDMSVISKDSCSFHHQHRQLKCKNLNENEEEQSDTDTDIDCVNHHIKHSAIINCNESMTLFYTEDKASGSKFSDSHSLSQKKVGTVASVEIQDDLQNEVLNSKTF